MNRAFISVGTNIEREKHARLGAQALRELDRNARFSMVYEAQAVGYSGNNYFNFIAEIKTSLNVVSLRNRLKQIEQRYEPSRHADGVRQRCLDLDIIIFSEASGHSMKPREDLHKFAFVLRPLSELAPDFIVCTEQQTLAQLWQQHSKRAVMRHQQLWPVDFII
ncbi:2-amino-4-hydroxy-6-hydroxymethyldihydropteridine diphosphokinase [Thaumasiovibrio sp. DFM-14]|uniref:2-amino-4-hydroxy-6- hydroxymethyldihydropteridine diphosphokinase n=1 Tax=Thaumasiovibrio sp. DFM-14 TaxID=3384792 RepID=UPI0039A0B270